MTQKPDKKMQFKGLKNRTDRNVSINNHKSYTL